MSEPLKTTALEEAVCPKCKANVWDCHAGGFRVKLNRLLMSKYEELENLLRGGSSFQITTRYGNAEAKLRLPETIKKTINDPQPLVVSLHDCKGEPKNATLPF